MSCLLDFEIERKNKSKEGFFGDGGSTFER